MRAKPNVVFILTDDQRFDAIGAAGSPVRTPNIDALVERGTWFTHAHVAGGNSGAICMPSRAMIHTGRGLFELEESGRSVPTEHRLLGELLQDAGYATFGTGKWHNGREAFARSFTHGDEIFFGGMADHWNVPSYHYDPDGCYEAELPVIDRPMETNEVRWYGADHVTPGRHSSDLIADATVSFLSSYPRDPGSPYFIYSSFLAPHDPRSMPAEFLEHYPPAEIELPPNFTGGHPFDNGDLHIRDEMLASHPRDPDEVREHIAQYYAMIAHLDACVGRIVDAVTARGDLERTVFVFAGDNGLAVGQHGLLGKQNLYDHSSRVPLLFAGPGVETGKRRDDLCYLFDIPATIAGLAGVEVPATMTASRDLLAHSAQRREHLYLAYKGFQRAIRTRTHKLIEYAVNGRHTVQLFNLESDPYELCDLSKQEASRGTLEQLTAAIEQEGRASGDADSSWGREFWDTARP
jgi:arylsulfatase A-like enzyme